MKHKIFHFALCISFFLIAEKTDYVIIQVSIPKCGTHLLGKCIELITGLKARDVKDISGSHLEVSTKVEDYLKSVRYQAHTWPSEKNVTFFSNNRFKGFFIYRDPRDFIVSMVFWSWKLGHNKEKYLNELIFDFIESPGYFDDYHFPLDVIYDLYINEWSSLSNFCTVRFEDLVGSKGGGSDQIQMECIRKIGEHLGYKLSHDDIKYLQENLYGNTLTFNVGQIGNWKNYFSDEHKKFFKEKTGNLLIELGYESDNSW